MQKAYGVQVGRQLTDGRKQVDEAEEAKQKKWQRGFVLGYSGVLQIKERWCLTQQPPQVGCCTYCRCWAAPSEQLNNERCYMLHVHSYCKSSWGEHAATRLGSWKCQGTKVCDYLWFGYFSLDQNVSMTDWLSLQAGLFLRAAYTIQLSIKCLCNKKREEL